MAKKKKNTDAPEDMEAPETTEESAESTAESVFSDLDHHDKSIRDVLELRRTAKEAKRYKVLMRILGLVVIILSLIVAAAYAISYFYDKFGSFTVRVDKYDMVRQGLSLSETPDYDISRAILNADIVYNMTNISGEDLPENIDMVNGSHNGDSYIAYTFYLINSGDDTISYEGEMNIESVTQGVDEAVRIALYQNGEKTVYGKTKSNGTGIESDCDSEFLSSTVIMRTGKEGFEPKARDKYTIVIWLEGNDPDCIDDIIGGTLKLNMHFSIVETT